ncbi:LysR substrate-binding domain-containing protein [Heyndrickxia sp. NPDC080065]|uniref:LysR substrate-binding domain-containing protein n=1 Tax=Heyndrickxia sp. NPDC080065 TaxID=3390568 RepID=UPI003D08DFB3
MDKELWTEKRILVWERDSKKCARGKVDISIDNCHIDHIKSGIFEDMEISPKITFEGDEADTVVGLVAAGLGISILPNMKGIDQSKISQLSIDSPQSRRTIGLAEVQGRYLSPATWQFKQFVFDYFCKSE